MKHDISSLFLKGIYQSGREKNKTAIRNKKRMNFSVRVFAHQFHTQKMRYPIKSKEWRAWIKISLVEAKKVF
jgi:hypothetical protein